MQFLNFKIRFNLQEIISASCTFWILFSLISCSAGGGSDSKSQNNEVEFQAKEHLCDHSAGIICGDTAQNKGTKFSRSAVYLDLLNKKDATIGACSGVIIDKKVILTAAHCLVDGVSAVLVHFSPEADDVSITNIKQRLVSDQFVIHPNYNSHAVAEKENIYDLGLIFLAKEVLRPFYPVEIAEENAEVFKESDDQKIYSMGFGRLGTNILTDHKLMYMTKQTDENLFHFIPEVAGFGWDQKSDGGICSGDSGGPVFIKKNKKYVLVGINSSVYYLDGTGKKDLCDYRGFATYIPAFKFWIDHEIDKKGL